MMRHALEKGLASLIAQFLLDARHSAIFDAVARAEALPPAELQRLRDETLAQLIRARDEGAPYADVVKAGLKEALSVVAELNPGLGSASSIASRVTQAAVQQAMMKSADLARAAAEVATAAKEIPDPPVGSTQTSET